MTERVQKALARAGLGSRRQADRWVAEGRVTVNGVTAEPGTRVGPGDEVRLDGRAVELDAGDLPTRVLAYYKPEGEVCTRSDPQGRPTIFDRLPNPGTGRWIQVGRLDLNSAGLILLTTDGHLAEALMHPSRQIEREYVARVRGTPSPATRERLLQGLDLEDGPARFTRVEKRPARGRHASLAVTLTEGRKREVRRLLETAGHPVSRLLRVRFGPVHLPRDLEPGEYRELEPDEVAGLRRAAGLNPEPEQGQP